MNNDVAQKDGADENIGLPKNKMSIWQKLWEIWPVVIFGILMLIILVVGMLISNHNSQKNSSQTGDNTVKSNSTGNVADTTNINSGETKIITCNGKELSLNLYPLEDSKDITKILSEMGDRIINHKSSYKYGTVIIIDNARVADASDAIDEYNDYELSKSRESDRQ